MDITDTQHAQGTERQGAIEAALRESELRYQQLADAMPHLVWTSDGDGAVDYYNSRAAVYDGLVRSPNGQWTWQPIVHADELASTLEAWQAAQSVGVYQHEHRLRMADGSYRWHLSRAEAMRGADGRIVKWFGTATDIHERRQAEDDTRFLAEFAEQLRTSDDPAALAAQVTQHLGEYLQVARCFFAEIDEANDQWSTQGDYAATLPSIAGSYRISDFSPAEVQAMRQGQVSIVGDTMSDEHSADLYLQAYAPIGVRAHVVVPFLRMGAWVSNLVVATDVPREWQPREVVLLQTVAERVWLTIEKLRLDAALRERTTLLNAILDGTTELIFVKDREGRIILANPALERTLATPSDVLRGRTDYQYLPDAADAAAITANDQRIMARGEGEVLEEIVATPHGRRVYLSNKVPWRDASGAVVGLIGIASDITERKRVEVLDHLLYQILDATRTIAAPEAITALVAQKLGEHMGVDRCAFAETEADENHFTITGDYTTPGTVSLVGRFAMADFGAEALRLMRAGRPYVVENSATDLRIDDARTYDEAQIAAVICVPLHKGGRFAGGMAVHQRAARHWTADEVELVQLVANMCWEALARARAERELRINEERYRSLVHATTSMVWTTDATGAFVERQPGWEGYTGQPWDEHKGWGWAAMIHPEDRARIEAAWRRALTTHSLYEARGRLWHAASNAHRTCVTRATPVLTPEGTAREWIGTVTDIHEQKRAEQAAEQARGRAAELYEAERSARAEAEGAVRARDQFLSVAAHELRTPLTSLLGNAQLLQRRAERTEVLAERERRNVQVIAEQAGRLNRMILALLDVSRIETGQLAIQRAPVDICQLIQRLGDEIRPSLEGRVLDVVCPDEPLVISGDELRLEQVFQNLIQNALKYSSASEPVRVEVCVRNSDVLVAVSDRGIGIPPQALPQLFQRFYRAHNVDQQQVSGLGIGLYVVREIVSLHGGSVEVTSAEGVGSTFTVCLPLAEAMGERQ